MTMRCLLFAAAGPVETQHQTCQMLAMRYLHGMAERGGDQNDRNDQYRDEVEHLADMHIWHIQAFRDVLLVAAVIAVFWAGYALRAVTVPLLVALLLAYLFEPVIQWLVRKPHMNRVRAVALLLGAGILTLLVVLAIALPLAISQTTRFVEDVRDGALRANIARMGRYVPAEYHDEFADVLELLPGEAMPADVETDPDAESEDAGARGDEDAGPGGNEQSEPVQTADPSLLGDINEQRLGEIIDQRIAVFEAQREAEATAEQQSLQPDWLQIARRGVRTIFSVLAFIISVGLLAFLIPFYFFFFSVWYPNVVSFGRQFIPRRNRERVLYLLEKMDNVVAGFVRGRIVISLIMGVLLAIGWMICGVPYAIPLGIVVGIFCAVPYLGVVGIPAAIALLFFEQLGLEQGERMAWWAVILWPAVVFSIVQLIEGYVLIPTIAGKATNLDPVTVLVAVLAGGSVLGIYGMLLAIPLAACGKIMFAEVLMPKMTEWAEGRREDPLPIERE